jgi:hypothetical protein
MMMPSSNEGQVEWRFEHADDGPTIARFANQDLARLERHAELSNSNEPWVLTYGNGRHEFRFRDRTQAMNWVRENLTLLRTAAAE